MPEPTTGTQDGQNPGGNEEPTTGTQPGQNAGGNTTGAPAGVALTQADIERAQAEVRRAADREHKKERDVLTERLKTLEDEKAKRDEAELSELQKAQKVAADAEVRRVAAEQALATAQVTALRANLVSQNAASLPAAYRAQITGDTQEEITASITATQAAFDADRTAMIQRLAAMTPEQIRQEFGDVGAALAERMQGKPTPSVGAPTNPPGQQAPPAAKTIEDMDQNEFMAEMAKQGIRVQL